MIEGKVVSAVILGRLGSSRLTNKLLKTISGKTAFELFIQRLIQSKTIDQYVFATTDQPEDDLLVNIANDYEILTYRGYENDIVSRILKALSILPIQTDFIVRANSDNPLIMPNIVDLGVASIYKSGSDIISPFELNTLPFGYSLVIMTPAVITKINNETQNPAYREHVENYCFEHPNKFKIKYQVSEKKLFYPDLNLTLDYEEDYQRINFFHNIISKVTIEEQSSYLLRNIKYRPIIFFLQQGNKDRVSTVWIEKLVQCYSSIKPSIFLKSQNGFTLVSNKRNKYFDLNHIRDYINTCNDPIIISSLNLSEIGLGTSDDCYQFNQKLDKKSNKFVCDLVSPYGDQIATEELNYINDFLHLCLIRIMAEQLPLLLAQFPRKTRTLEAKIPPKEKTATSSIRSFAHKNETKFPEFIFIEEITITKSIKDIMARVEDEIILSGNCKVFADENCEKFCRTYLRKIEKNISYQTKDLFLTNHPEINPFNSAIISDSLELLMIERGNTFSVIGSIKNNLIHLLWRCYLSYLNRIKYLENKNGN